MTQTYSHDPQRQYTPQTDQRPAWAANLLGLDYKAEAKRLGPPPCPIVDIHTHINGPRAAEIYQQACCDYGIDLTYTMSRIDGAADVRDVMGDAIRFIAVPNFMSEDRGYAFRQGYVDDVKRWHEEFGAQIVKFWVAPRHFDMFTGDDADLRGLESPWRIKAAELAADLGMMFMVHVSDPDTWFQTKYADASVYGTKADQYPPLERFLDRFPDQPCIAAHMCGSPEDLDFIDGMLERHPNLYIDTSATKWQVRELSRHEPARFLAFLQRWQGRVLFGTDIVTTDGHLSTPADPGPEASQVQKMQYAMAKAAGSAERAYELYASRMWANRVLHETSYRGPSPIADPDLPMIDPTKYDETSSPELWGRGLPSDVLKVMYRGAADALVGVDKKKSRIVHERGSQ